MTSVGEDMESWASHTVLAGVEPVAATVENSYSTSQSKAQNYPSPSILHLSNREL